MVFKFNFRLHTIISLILVFGASTSCKVGPNFHTPALPDVKQFTESSFPKKTVASPGKGGNSQIFQKDKDIPLLWWELYHSPEINELIKVGLANSPTLAAATAALNQSRENWKVQIGNLLLPAIDNSNQLLRQHFSATQIGFIGYNDTFSLYNPAFNISYILDIWGGARRQVESFRAQVDYQQFKLIAANLTLTSNIATTAINIASYNAQIKATKELIQIEKNILEILKNQYQLGGKAQTDVLIQQTQLEQTIGTLPPLEYNLAQAKHMLSMLIGTYPDRPLPTISLDKLILPGKLPLTLPSMLVRQRPDVRAAEALLHAACAQIGVATANLLPQLILTGNNGWMNTSWAQLFTKTNNVWLLAAQLSQPIFHGGALFAQKRAAMDAFKQSAAQYQQTVLVAFQNVADVLDAIETDARYLKAQVRAEHSAHASLILMRNQYRLGGVDFISLLNVEQQYQQAKISRIQAQATRYTDTAALFQALGGGWWHKPWCVNECL